MARNPSVKTTLQEGDRVYLTISSTSSSEIADNYRAGERGTIVHVFQEGSYGFSEVVIELDRCCGRNDRRIRICAHQCRLINVLDRLAELG